MSPGEQCDDGNNVSGDGCSATCQNEVVPYCGDGKWKQGEECDDGNTRDGDGCSRFCDYEVGECGDGILQTALGEQCDDGNRVNGDGCAADCTFERTADCGDGAVNPQTEQCDSGPGNTYLPSACRPNCIAPYCGDSVLDFNEVCDDGNRLGGDGCSALCELEPAAAPLAAELLPRQIAEAPREPEAYPNGGPQPARIPTPARTKTGPGLVIFLASGAAAGAGLARRRFLASGKR